MAIPCCLGKPRIARINPSLKYPNDQAAKLRLWPGADLTVALFPCDRARYAWRASSGGAYGRFGVNAPKPRGFKPEAPSAKTREPSQATLERRDDGGNRHGPSRCALRTQASEAGNNRGRVPSRFNRGEPSDVVQSTPPSHGFGPAKREYMTTTADQRLRHALYVLFPPEEQPVYNRPRPSKHNVTER